MEQNIKGASGEDLTGEEWLSLNEQGRAIALDYPLKPFPRDLYNTPGGKVLLRYFSQHHSEYQNVIDSLPELSEFFTGIPLSGDPAELAPFWNNGWFPPLDALSLCALLYKRRPKRYIEIGSGNSTKFARSLIDKFDLPTKIISIDPYPRADIDQLCSEVVRQPLEDVPVTFFAELNEEDMLFIDSSHRSFQNSDVTVFFIEILPALATGIVYGIHDIFLPFDYPASFSPRFYSEQYLLAAYLLGGTSDVAIFPSFYVAAHANQFEPLQNFGTEIGIGDIVLGGGAFWARKGVPVHTSRSTAKRGK